MSQRTCWISGSVWTGHGGKQNCPFFEYSDSGEFEQTVDSNKTVTILWNIRESSNKCWLKQKHRRDRNTFQPARDSTSPSPHPRLCTAPRWGPRSPFSQILDSRKDVHDISSMTIKSIRIHRSQTTIDFRFRPGSTSGPDTAIRSTGIPRVRSHTRILRTSVVVAVVVVVVDRWCHLSNTGCFYAFRTCDEVAVVWINI